MFKTSDNHAGLLPSFLFCVDQKFFLFWVMVHSLTMRASSKDTGKKRINSTADIVSHISCLNFCNLVHVIYGLVLQESMMI